MDAQVFRLWNSNTQPNFPDQKVVDLVDVVGENDAFASLCETLIGRVAKLEREAGRFEVELEESLGIGHWLADQLDETKADLAKSRSEVRRLKKELGALTDLVANIASSPLAIPIRRRLLFSLAAV